MRRCNLTRRPLGPGPADAGCHGRCPPPSEISTFPAGPWPLHCPLRVAELASIVIHGMMGFVCAPETSPNIFLATSPCGYAPFLRSICLSAQSSVGGRQYVLVSVVGSAVPSIPGITHARLCILPASSPDTRESCWLTSRSCRWEAPRRGVLLADASSSYAAVARTSANNPCFAGITYILAKSLLPAWACKSTSHRFPPCLSRTGLQSRWPMAHGGLGVVGPSRPGEPSSKRLLVPWRSLTARWDVDNDEGSGARRWNTGMSTRTSTCMSRGSSSGCYEAIGLADGGMVLAVAYLASRIPRHAPSPAITPLAALEGARAATPARPRPLSGKLSIAVELTGTWTGLPNRGDLAYRTGPRHWPLLVHT